MTDTTSRRCCGQCDSGGAAIVEDAPRTFSISDPPEDVREVTTDEGLTFRRSADGRIWKTRGQSYDWPSLLWQFTTVTEVRR